MCLLTRTNLQVLLNNNVLIAVDQMRFVPYVCNFFRDLIMGKASRVAVVVAELPHPPRWDS